jgi:glycosyltransferase involved in cell wall biosynthesis
VIFNSPDSSGLAWSFMEVKAGRTGLVVPPRDPASLAEAPIRLLRDEPLRRKLGAAGRRKLDAEASPALVARRTLAVY